MTVDFKNDRDADGRGCISDVISIDIRTGKIEREKIYNDYDRLGESSETFAMKPTELPEAAKVVFELTQDKAIQGLFPKQEKSQKSEFSAGDEVLNDDFGGKHKEHKKDNRRRNGQKERAFAAQCSGATLSCPETLSATSFLKNASFLSSIR